MRFFFAAVIVLSLLAIDAAESSRQWQRYKNEHGCAIVPRRAEVPRSYTCNGVACRKPRECAPLTEESAS